MPKRSTTPETATIRAEVRVRVKQLRQERGFSARSLAEEMQALGFNATRQMIANVESGRAELGVEFAVGLARAMRLRSLDEMVGGPNSEVSATVRAEVEKQLAQINQAVSIIIDEASRLADNKMPSPVAAGEGDETKTEQASKE